MMINNLVAQLRALSPIPLTTLKEVIYSTRPIDAFFTNIYWLFFLLPGLATVHFLADRKILHEKSGIVEKFVFSFFYSALFLLPFNIFSFFITIPSILAVIYSLILTVAAIAYLMKVYGYTPATLFPGLWKSIKIRLTGVKPIYSFFISIFALDFLMAQAIKAFALYEFDAWMHISKINFMVNNGLSKFDPYFLENGKNVVSSNYASNLLHTIFVIPTKFFSFFGGIEAFSIWSYSLGFFRLFSYGVVYLLTDKLVKNKYVAALVTTIYFLTNFMTLNQGLVEYPTKVAFLFLLVTLVVLLETLDRLTKGSTIVKSPTFYIFALGVLSVSFLHQIQWALLTLFVGGLTVAYWAFKELRFRNLMFINLALLSGLFTSIYTKVASKYIPADVFGIGDSYLFRLSDKLYSLVYQDGALTATTLTILAGLVVSLAVVKNERSRIFIGYFFLYTAILYYTPLYVLINKFLPTFGIVRHNYFIDIMNWILIMIPLWYLLDFVVKKYKISDKISYFMVGVVLITLALPYQKDLKMFYDVSVWNQGSAIVVNQLLSFKPLIKPHSIILTNKSVSFSIPGVYNAYAAALDSTRTTDSISTKKSREVDMVSFLFDEKQSAQNKNEILKKNKVDYVILDAGEKVIRPMISDINIAEISKTKDYILYEVK